MTPASTNRAAKTTQLPSVRATTPGRAKDEPAPNWQTPDQAPTPAPAKSTPGTTPSAPGRATASDGAIEVPTPNHRAPRRTKTPAPFRAEPAPIRPMTGRATTSGRAKAAPEPETAAPGRIPTPTPTKLVPTPKVAPSVRDQTPQAPPADGSTPMEAAAGLAGSILYDPALYLLAAQLDNVESLRIAAENRHRQATRAVADVDGHLRGLGLPDDNPAVVMSAAMVDALKETEHRVELALARTVRAHPLGRWQKATLGVGEKQLARLLASIGDPYWNESSDRPRRVSDLWSYCGVGDAAKQIRKRGERANWSATAKFRSWLIATKCVMTLRSPFRPVYDEARAKYAEAVHVGPCVRCGPAGKPAAAGSPLSLGHQHARGLRAVQKEILRSLWLEARRLHTPGADQAPADNQSSDVGAGPHLPAGQPTTENQSPRASGNSSDIDQSSTEARTGGVDVGPNSGALTIETVARLFDVPVALVSAGTDRPTVGQGTREAQALHADGGGELAAPPLINGPPISKDEASGAGRRKKVTV